MGSNLTFTRYYIYLFNRMYCTVEKCRILFTTTTKWYSRFTDMHCPVLRLLQLSPSHYVRPLSPAPHLLSQTSLPFEVQQTWKRSRPPPVSIRWRALPLSGLFQSPLTSIVPKVLPPWMLLWIHPSPSTVFYESRVHLQCHLSWIRQSIQKVAI